MKSYVISVFRSFCEGNSLEFGVYWCVFLTFVGTVLPQIKVKLCQNIRTLMKNVELKTTIMDTLEKKLIYLY